MIYDRTYMREPTGPNRGVSVLAWLIGGLVAIFLLQHVVDGILPGGYRSIERYVALSGELGNGFVWTLVTYGFLHDNLWHILMNSLGLFLLGRVLLPVTGTARFALFGLGSIVIGGLAWYAVGLTTGIGGNLVGISAMVCGLVAVFGTLFGEQRIGFLFLPWTFPAKYFAAAFAILSLILMVTAEIPGYTQVAHSSHLGGMLAGWLYARYVHHRTGEFSLRPSIELPAWMRRRKRAKARVAPTYQVNVTPPPADLRAEVDRVLDKINSEGFGSLTEDERRVLDDARDLLNKR